MSDSLRFLGHEVKVFDIHFAFGKGHTLYYIMKRFSERYDQMKAQQLAHQVLKYEPDVVIGVYRIIHPRTIEIIKQKSPETIVIHVNPDALVNLQQQQIFAFPYDHYFTKDPYMQHFMKHMAGLNAHCLPEAFNPRYYKTTGADRNQLEKEENIDVLIFGNMYPYRARIVDQIRQAGLKVSLYGARSRYFPTDLEFVFNDRAIYGVEKSKKIIGAKVVLNCFHYSEIEGVNVKYFEINGIGGFQVCDFKPTLKEYSPVDPIQYSYQDTQQAIELIRYYLDRPNERHQIAETQREYFLKHHTYENRMNTIMNVIKKNS